MGAPAMDQVKVKDHQLLINVAAFCKDVLLEMHQDWFNDWAFIYTHTIISLSTK